MKDKKRIFTVIMIASLLFFLFILIKHIYLENEISPATPISKVNLSSEVKKIKSKEFNEMLSEKAITSYRGVKSFLPKRKNIKVCVLDSFKKKEHEVYSHGELVSMVINKYYEGNIYQYNILDGNYRTKDFSKCDVLNYSMIIRNAKDREDFYKELHNGLKNFKGIIIAAAGNSGPTKDMSEWAYYKHLKNKDEDLLNRVILVSQGSFIDEDLTELDISASYGPEVDIIVTNKNEYIGKMKLKGSSFAAPVISSIVANLLEAGIDRKYVKKILKKNKRYSNNNITYEDDLKYSVLNMKRTYMNAYNYIK